MGWNWIQSNKFELKDDQDEDESNTEKPDTKQGDRPLMAEKVAPVTEIS